MVAGAEDRLTPPRYARFLAETIPGARLVEIQAAGHFPQLEQPRRSTPPSGRSSRSSDGAATDGRAGMRSDAGDPHQRRRRRRSGRLVGRSRRGRIGLWLLMAVGLPLLIVAGVGFGVYQAFFRVPEFRALLFEGGRVARGAVLPLADGAVVLSQENAAAGRRGACARG